MTDTAEPRLKPLADAIEEALARWSAPYACKSARCLREDCFRHQEPDQAGPCRARSEFIAARISGAAVEYAAKDIALVRQEIAAVGERVERMAHGQIG